jgi:hypothetical protein
LESPPDCVKNWIVFQPANGVDANPAVTTLTSSHL